jgi:hypothetical protein
MAKFKPVDPRGYGCVNVLVQRAIGKVKSRARARYKQHAMWNDPDGKRKLQAHNARMYANNKEVVISKAATWNKRHIQRRNIRLRGWANKYMKERRASDPAFDLRCKMRSRVHRALRSKQAALSASASTLLCCSYEELHNNLACQVFENESLKTLQVDHIFPLVRYDMCKNSAQQASCHFTNLQPLPAADNRSKFDRLPTKAMAAKVDPACWPDGVTMDMLPDIYPGWATPLRMHA